MERFLKDMPTLYQFIIEGVIIIIGAGIALPGQRKWGWLVFALGIAGVIWTIKTRILTLM
ncbi:MAG: hypothetical protein NT106_00620 [Candidatus Sumerlaeota bacterium]|nr:hypothetical protein [Candidatus Sumerlaeota bacterium]